MTSYTFKPNGSSRSVNWHDTNVWSGGVVPNGADADVDFPTVTELSSGQDYVSFVTIAAGESYATHSVTLRDYLVVNGSLMVGAGLTIVSQDGEVDLSSATLTAGTITNSGIDIQGSGTINVGALINTATVIGSGLTLNAQQIVNSGVLGGASGTLSVNTPSGGLVGLANGTLSAGTLEGYTGGTLALNVGSLVTVDDATILLSGGTVTARATPAGPDVALTSSLHSIAAHGQLTIDTASYRFDQLDVAGHVTLLNSGGMASDHLTVDRGGVLQGWGSINSAVENDGLLLAGNFTNAESFYGAPTQLTLNGAISGSGAMEIGEGRVGGNRFDFGYSSLLEINGATAQNVLFADNTGRLQLDQPSTFTGAIGTAGSGDRITLAGVGLSSITSYSYSGDVYGGTLTLNEAGGAMTLKFLGAYTRDSFTLAAGPQQLSSDPASLVITANPNVTYVPGDYLPHGDIIWRNTNGAVSEWQIYGNPHATQVRADTYDASADTSWKIAETFDWNGDGKTDLLWRNTNGTIAIWNGASNGTFQQSAYLDSTVGTGWSIAATGDMNGDGKSDILWRYQDGQISAWTSRGTDFAENSYSHASVGTSWKVEGLADVNGDGKADIVWRNDNGAFSTWLANGSGGFQEASYNSAALTSWHIAGLGDFNGDGRADVLWLNDNGAVSVWSSNGNGFDQGTFNAAVAVGWHVAEVGDFNGDGRADILWRNDNGAISTWEANGSGFTQAVYNGSVDPGWSIAGHAFPL